jgi:hypothetical protein
MQICGQVIFGLAEGHFFDPNSAASRALGLMSLLPHSLTLSYQALKYQPRAVISSMQTWRIQATFAEGWKRTRSQPIGAPSAHASSCSSSSFSRVWRSECTPHRCYSPIDRQCGSSGGGEKWIECADFSFVFFTLRSQCHHDHAPSHILVVCFKLCLCSSPAVLFPL